MRRALFLDRDGIVDELVYYESSDEWESPRNLDDLKMLDASPLQRFVDAGWLLFIITNQPSFAKGKTSLEELHAVQDAVIRALPVPIAQSYLCFHRSEDQCECRKPKPYFLQQAARDFDVDLSASWMVGDQDSDLLCGRAAGCKVALLENPRSANKRGNVEPDLRVGSLAELASALIPTSSASP